MDLYRFTVKSWDMNEFISYMYPMAIMANWEISDLYSWDYTKGDV